MGKIVFVVNVLVYICRLFMHRTFYEGHYATMVVCAEGGFIVGVVALVLALVCMRNRWKLTVAIGSVVLAYLWFSDIEWWVMVK